ncbi:MAG TPA: hypothetical protein PKD86_06615 [Gemmatales bacterium]|nr:hypothetical protein [Gemmatales bacterium]HMP59009.1 hypothetical protein [Gemmatales bacterium]
MSETELLQRIEGHIRAVRCRQTGQLLLQALPGALAVLLLLAAAWHVAEPWLAAPLPWNWLPASLALLLGVATALAWTLLRRPSATTAALALDHAFELRERMTTAVHLTSEQRDTPAGQALLADARGHLDGIRVPERFPFQFPPRRALAPLGALVCVLLAAGFAPGPRDAQPVQLAQKPAMPAPEPIDVQALRQENEDRKQRIKEIDSEELAELTADFDKLLAQLEKPQETRELQLQVQELTRLSEQVQKRQEELAKVEDLKRQLRADAGLKNMDEGPAKAMHQALAEGKMPKALEELKKLAEKMARKELSDQERQQLEKQLKDLQEKLNNLAQQRERMDNLARSDMDPETRQREQESIQRDIAKMRDLQRLADALGQCQKALESGDQKELMEQLAGLAEELEEMELTEKELAELQKMELDLEELKECMGC